MQVSNHFYYGPAVVGDHATINVVVCLPTLLSPHAFPPRSVPRLGYHMCSVAANCTNTDGAFPLSYNCSCGSGYTGDGVDCEPLCTPSCVHGVCSSPGNCTCAEGWQGPSCEQCSPGDDKCPPNSACSLVEGLAYHMCACEDGYEVADGGGCAPVCRPACVHGECAQPGKCQCSAGWEGDNCTMCVQGAHAACHLHSVCSDRNGSLACDCLPGYVGDGAICEPVCSPGCGAKGSCSSPNTCACEAGFSGDLCRDCANEWGHLHGCHRNATCSWDGLLSNGTSGITLGCHCETGFAGNGSDCQPICDLCVRGVCESPGYCRCDLGAAGPGCTECDEQMSVCHANASCGMTLAAAKAAAMNSFPNSTANMLEATFVPDGGYFCACNAGFIGNGLECRPLCSLGCEHGDCEYRLGQVFGQCRCHEGWHSLNCSQCSPSSDPCGEFAACTSTSHGQSCHCLPGYGNVPPCLPVCTQGCDNGQCVRPDECKCATGFGGASCSECSSDHPWYAGRMILLPYLYTALPS